VVSFLRFCRWLRLPPHKLGRLRFFQREAPRDCQVQRAQFQSV